MNKKTQQALQKYEEDSKPYYFDEERQIWSLHYAGNRPVLIKNREVDFMDVLLKTGDRKEARRKAAVTEQEMNKMMESDNFRRVYQDKLERKSLKENLDDGWYYKELMRIYGGEKKDGFTVRERLEALKELGARVSPKPERKSPGVSQPTININMGALEESLERRKRRAIDVEAEDE